MPPKRHRPSNVGPTRLLQQAFKLQASTGSSRESERKPSPPQRPGTMSRLLAILARNRADRCESSFPYPHRPRRIHPPSTNMPTLPAKDRPTPQMAASTWDKHFTFKRRRGEALPTYGPPPWNPPHSHFMHLDFLSSTRGATRRACLGPEA